MSRLKPMHRGKSKLPDLRILGLDYAGVDIDGHRFVPPTEEHHLQIQCSCHYHCFRPKQFAQHLALVQEGKWKRPGVEA